MPIRFKMTGGVALLPPEVSEMALKIFITVIFTVRIVRAMETYSITSTE
jgi:hypothetical protein